MTMENDLVERLRSRKGEAITRVERLLDEAASRIQALEAELATANRLLKTKREFIDAKVSEWERVEAELARKTEALTYAHKGLDMVHNGLMDPTRPRQAVGEVCFHFLDAARAALTEQS